MPIPRNIIATLAFGGLLYSPFLTAGLDLTHNIEIGINGFPVLRKAIKGKILCVLSDNFGTHTVLTIEDKGSYCIYYRRMLLLLTMMYPS